MTRQRPFRSSCSGHRFPGYRTFRSTASNFDRRPRFARACKYSSVISAESFSASAVATSWLMETFSCLASSRAFSCRESGKRRLIVLMYDSYRFQKVRRRERAYAEIRGSSKILEVVRDDVFRASGHRDFENQIVAGVAQHRTPKIVDGLVRGNRAQVIQHVTDFAGRQADRPAGEVPVRGATIGVSE